MTDELTVFEKLIADIDETTRARMGALSARGLLDNQIADMLLVTVEHVVAVKETIEFRAKYAAEADRIIQENFDRDEGWDAVEDMALATLVETMKFNRDPKFALLAAKTANTAERRARKNSPKIVDSSGNGGNSSGSAGNLVILNINKIYVDRAGEDKMLNINTRPKELPLKQSDMPSPKLIDQILAPARERSGELKKPESELEAMFRESGVVFDGN